MKSAITTAAVLSALALVPTGAIRILQSNDDGWAEQNARAFHDALIAAGHQTVLSCPAENKSGSGSLDTDPSPRTKPCEYDSCPANSGPIGRDTKDATLNWVNSYPVTSVRYGFDVITPPLWQNESAELVVSGPNVGSNIWLQVPFSGTVGVAAYAAKERGVPSIAFSGASLQKNAWNAPPSPESKAYAAAATKITQRIIDSGVPYLPKNVFLNVNMPKLDGSKCSQAADMKFILTRINPGQFSAPDVNWCGSTRLPTELDVHTKGGCLASISIGDATDKTTVNDDRQQAVLDKLKPLLSCMDD